MATTKQPKAAAAAPQAPAAPQPTHGGVYELVGDQLQVVEGGPPVAEPAAPAADPQPVGEGA